MSSSAQHNGKRKATHPARRQPRIKRALQLDAAGPAQPSLAMPSLTLPEREVVLAQLNKFRVRCGDPELTDETAAPRLKEYNRFQTIKRTLPSAVPSELIDDVWHAHILCSNAYFAWCVRHLGSIPGGFPIYLHHDPSAGSAAAYSETIQIYRTTFGEDPPFDLWPPPPDDVVERASGGGSAEAKGKS